MFKYFKKILSNITFKIITDFIKDKIIYLLPFIFTYGGNMITESVIG